MLTFSKTSTLPMILAGAALFAASGPARAADKFKVTSVDCEMFWLWKHTPVIHYDIIDERKADYHTNPTGEYFAGAAARTADYCDRTSVKAQNPLAPPRRIKGIWFQSNDGQVKILLDLESRSLDTSAVVKNRIADEYAADQRSAAQHEAQLEAIRTQEARAEEIKAAQEKAAQDRIAAQKTSEGRRQKDEQDKIAAELAREQLFFDSKGLQVSRLGTEVTAANFTLVDNVRTNPFHFRKLGLAVVRTQFNRMVTDKIALFGDELAPILVHIDDVDRFTRSGETVMLSFKVIERGEVERSYGSLPEIIISALKAEPLFGEYVGAYTCPSDDCGHIFDAPPPT